MGAGKGQYIRRMGSRAMIGKEIAHFKRYPLGKIEK